MENNNINQFDSMLRQSLEGAKVPVPNGIWESVGTTIGAKATIASKISVLKILSLKYISVTIISGAMIWGAYKVLNNKNDVKSSIENSSSNENFVKQNEEIIKPDINSNNESGNSKIVKNTKTNIEFPPIFNDSSIESNQVNISDKKDTSSKHFTDKNKTNPKIQDNDKSNKEPVNNTKTNKESQTNNDENSSDNKNSESKTNIYSSENIIIPNAFTPYDIDGLNDCYKVLIENEVKFVLQIFDDNHQIVFETTDKNNCWNGTNKNTGEMCRKGAYSFKLIYELNSGYKKTERGLINLF